MLDRTHWIQMLRNAATPALSDTPLLRPSRSHSEALAWAQGFTDTFGARRPCDLPMLAHMMGLGLDHAADQVRQLELRQPDAALWWLLHAKQPTPLTLIDAAGPLFPRLHAQAIEMWTEAELSGLHALSWHARLDPTLAPRCDSAARWLIAELQPDNATNRPWALHVFADLSLREDLDATLRADASMYAQTLLHNCQVGGQVNGSIDRFSACILVDAVDALTQHAARP